jgi:transcriptional regulator GlxA family with amidase domain
MAVGVGIAGALGALGLERTRAEPDAARLPERPLPVPTEGFIRTAVAIGPGANVIDLSGPWEVFQDAAVAGGAAQFELYTVAEDMNRIDASGGLRIEPAYTYRTAPQPHLVVVPAHDATERLLDGKTATTHHQSCDALEASFPSIRVLRHRRFVEHEHVATAGGLSSGIDLALRVVERYLGRDAAAATAAYMEYERRSPAIA